MSGFILERFAIQSVIFGYAIFILGPYLSFFAWWLIPVLFIAIMGACAVKGRRIDQKLLRLWDRLDTPNKKAAVYFGAAFAPMLWLPLTKFSTLLGLSLFLLGVFIAPACLKVLSRKHLALTTLALTIAVFLFDVVFGPPGKFVLLLTLPMIGLLLIFLPYTVLVLGLYVGTMSLLTHLLTRMSLMTAIESGNLFFVRRLLDAGKDIDGTIGDETPLHWAVQLKKHKIIALLLDRGARIDPKNGADQTPLILAARAGDTETVRLLIENGADIDAKDIRGEDALTQARALGHEDAADLLEKEKKKR